MAGAGTHVDEGSEQHERAEKALGQHFRRVGGVVNMLRRGCVGSW